MPRGYGGVAILWRKELDPLISHLKAGNSRIQCIELEGDPTIIIVSLYLPSKGPTNSTQELLECIDQLNGISPEILSHFLLTCESLETDRKRLMEIIIDIGSELLAKSCFLEEVDLVQLIVNPFYYTVDKRNNGFVQNIAGQLERVCRQLVNNLHMKRYKLLTKQQKCEMKNNLS
ncbi:unnamed protein product [Mytilus coruscus]|uniref:Uncharacterized protein n=1 Tax=Mytilus coruscus TaxID=42192 RepID=A0A6J8D7U0_MYTCO|nr:unnamed protein product [Mytilus coruscus]